MRTTTPELSILIVEEKQNFQSILMTVAGGYSRELVVVNSAEKALEKLADRDFDLVIMGEFKRALDVITQATQKNPLGRLLFFTNDLNDQKAARSIASEVYTADYEQMALAKPVMALLESA